jgi:Ca2+-binding RTX toxin-like protein
MIFQPSGIIIALSIIAILTTSFVSVSAIELNFTGDTTNNFTKNLKSKIDNLISNALNDTDSMLNSSFITNGSNLTSNNVIISNNKVASVVSSNGSDGSSSIIKDQVKTINGVCSSIKVGGNGNDTLASSGKCNDELTGGPGADKFMCGDGNDTVSDYNSKEGDVILDRQNCEKIQ